MKHIIKGKKNLKKIVYIWLITLLFALTIIGLIRGSKSNDDIIGDISVFCEKIEISFDIGPEEPMYMFNKGKNIEYILDTMEIDQWVEGGINEEISAIEYLYLYTEEYKYIVGILEYSDNRTGFDVVKMKENKVCGGKIYLAETVGYSDLINELRTICKAK